MVASYHVTAMWKGMGLSPFLAGISSRLGVPSLLTAWQAYAYLPACMQLWVRSASERGDGEVLVLSIAS